MHAAGPAARARKNRVSAISRGFTLLEVLVSLVVATLVLGAALAILQSTLRVRDWTEAHKLDRAATGRLVDLVAADLRQVVPQAGRKDRTTLEWIVDENGTWRLEMVTFSSFALGEIFPAGLRKVRYLYDPREQLLQRREEPLVGTGPEPGEWSVLSDGLGRFRLSFCDGTEWLERWPPPGQSGLLPVAVRIELSLGTGTGATEASRLVRVPAAAGGKGSP